MKTDRINPSILLAAVQRTLKNGPSTLDQLWLEHASVWQPLGWCAQQVSLWLACVSGVRRCDLPTGEHGYVLDDQESTSAVSLADELVALLANAGHPMPLAKLMCKLPAGVVVTEHMLRAIAIQDNRLELKGPLLKLA